MFGLLNNDDLDDEWSHNESLLAKDVVKIIHQFERYSLFYPIDKNGFVDLTTCIRSENLLAKPSLQLCWQKDNTNR